MKSAIRDNHPVVFFEHQMLAQQGVKGPVPEEEYTIPIGVADEIVAILAEASTTFRALKAPLKRVCAPDMPIPYTPVMERFCLPDKARIIAGNREVLV